MPSSADDCHAVSLPNLIDFDWRIDLVSASNNVDRMAVPRCLLQLKVEGNGNYDPKSDVSNSKNVTVELTKETLDTMLDGLGRIRDQLNSVASK